jgi:hypothetical protein
MCLQNILLCPAPDGKECAKSPSIEALRLHLEKNHGIVCQVEKRTFSSKSEFIAWKEDIQTASKSLFVRLRAHKGSEQWHCNRSGSKRESSKRKPGAPREKSKKKPVPRGKGSEKTGAQCPAMISAKYTDDGQVEIMAYMSHVGHEHNICFLPLSTAAREKAMMKLKEGVDPDKIAEIVRSRAFPLF